MEDKLKEWLAVKVDEERYLHSLRVLELIPELTQAYNVSPEPLRLAALLHDCARGMSDAEMLRAAEEWSLPVRPVDRDCPVLLHGRLAVEMARCELDLTDPVMVSAVLNHTAGHPGMTLADKLFFLADMIEPGRGFDRIVELRAVAYVDADRAMLLAIEINKAHLNAMGRFVDPVTLELQRMLESFTERSNG